MENRFPRQKEEIDIETNESSALPQAKPWIPPPDTDDIATWAWFYAEILGWPVLPIAGRDKVPLTDHALGISHGVTDATTDPDEVRWLWYEHPEANVGIACGDIVVIDIDGPEGFRSFQEIDYPSKLTLFATTGGGGVHLVYLVPDGRSAKNTTGKLGDHIDTRGAGGYIVAPPSIHPSGKRYTWKHWVAPQPADELILVPLEPPAPPPPELPVYGNDGDQYGVRAMVGELEHLVVAKRGTRNATLNVTAMNIGSLVAGGYLSEPYAHEQLMRAATACWQADGEHPPLGEITRTIESGMKAGLAKPRIPKGQR